jgi:hypothetical protein
MHFGTKNKIQLRIQKNCGWTLAIFRYCKNTKLPISQVLSKDSSVELAESEDFPGPMMEIRFWEAKCMNLESVYEQMKAVTTQKMASILNLTDRY